MHLSLSRLTSGSIFPDCLAIESKASVTSRSNCSEVPRTKEKEEGNEVGRGRTEEREEGGEEERGEERGERREKERRGRRREDTV